MKTITITLTIADDETAPVVEVQEREDVITAIVRQLYSLQEQSAAERKACRK